MLHNYAVKFGQTPLGSAMVKIFEGGLSFFREVYTRACVGTVELFFVFFPAPDIKVGRDHGIWAIALISVHLLCFSQAFTVNSAEAQLVIVFRARSSYTISQARLHIRPFDLLLIASPVCQTTICLSL